MSEHPRLPGRLAAAAQLADADHSWPVAQSDALYRGAYLNLSVDTIVDRDGRQHPRTIVRPHGAVGIVAIDDEDRLLLVEQYRHPVRQRLLEIPAGTLDVDGESALDAAQRELAEETDIRAARWEPLLSLFATPGYSSEAWQVFRAHELSPVPVELRTRREAEEAEMLQWWIPLEDALRAVFDGRIHDAMTVSAILAVQACRKP